MRAFRIFWNHPGVADRALSANKPESAFDITVQSLALLRQAGLSEADARNAYHAFVLMLQGYPLWREGYDRHEDALGCPSGLDAEGQFEDSIDWLLKLVALEAKENRSRKKPQPRLKTPS